MYTASHVESTARSRIGTSCSEPLNLLAKPGTALPHAPFPIPLCAHAAMALNCIPALSSQNRTMYIHDRARSHTNTIATRVSLCLKLTRNCSKCPEKRLKGYEKHLKEFKKRYLGARTDKLSIRTWGNKYFRGGPSISSSV